ncbi:MAG TPA: CPBP family glutamic-type intramembrane protease [Bryobacteraceae bacterium]|nr:CPBP family glutamic-type intramembrane protease [Bryobacteraceae bacterium]
MTTPLQPADKRLIALTLILIVASAAYVSLNYNAAFPQASLTLPFSRDQITQRARDVLKSQSLSTKDFRNLTVFDPDEEARLYLERELGLEQANRLMESAVPVWQWRARWFRPPEKEEMIVRLRPDGRLTAFEHRIPETDPGGRLDRISARKLAEAFLQAQTDRPQKLVAEQTESRPNRDDHLFTWEQQDFRAKDATIRRTVVIYGGKVGKYQEFLYVPEQWRRDFATLRSSNELYAAIAQGFNGLLILAVLLSLLQGVRRHTIPWRPMIRISGVVALFYLLNELNTLPFAIDGMAATSRYSEMILLALLQAIGAAAGILIYVLAPAAASANLGLTRILTPHGVATRGFFRATLAGFSLAAAHMAFITAFYLIGKRYGVWSPQDFDYSDLLGTPVPWIYPVATAMMAAVSEEFWFRLFAIPFLLKFVRYRWLAVVIPAFVWGFLHANYPQAPGYIRGVEVGVIGIVAGWMMLRFGILATLVWHFTIDAVLMGLFLFRAENWQYRIHGGMVALFILAPLLVSIVWYRRNGGFLPEPREEAEPAPTLAPVEGMELDEPLRPPWPVRYLYASSAVLGVIALAARTTPFGDFIRVSVTRDAAEAAAVEQMRQRNLDPARWRVATDFTANLRAVDAEYLRQQVGAARANAILRDRLITAIWRVRFFQPLKPEEWIFYVNQKGEAYRFDHVLDEKSPGAMLATEEARHIAEHYVMERHHIPIQTYTLVDSQEEKHPLRTDHSFVWEDPQFRAGEARFRVSLDVIGNETSEYRQFLKLPEAWLLDYGKTRIASFLLPSFLGAIGVSLLITFLRRLGSRTQRFHWRIYVGIAVCGAILAALSALNEYPSWLRSYDTSTPLNHFYARMISRTVGSLLYTAAALFGVALAVDVFLQLIAPQRAIPALSQARAAAIAVLVGSTGAIMEWIQQRTPGPHLNPSLWDLAGMDAMFPALQSLAGSYAGAVIGVGGAAVLICGAFALLSPRGMRRMVAAVIVVLTIGKSLEPVQAPFALAVALLGFAVLALIVFTTATDILSVATGVFWALIAGAAWLLLQQPAVTLRYSAIPLVLGAYGLTLWPMQYNPFSVRRKI